MDMPNIIQAFNTNSPTALKLGEVPEDPDTLHIGIIGCGRIGQTHAHNIVHRLMHASLVCVSDVFESAAVKCAQKFNVPMACTDAKDLINNPAVQAVIVCSPTDTHAEIIRLAAASGKHIFCEKPVDKSLATIEELSAVVRDSGVKFFLGFQRRFDDHFNRCKKAREEGLVGTALKLHLVSRDPSPPPVGYLKQSGGLFLDMSSHDFDMARYLMGSDITEITANAMAFDKEIGGIDDVDHTLCTVKFENGAMGLIDNSRTSALGYDQRAELFGTEGSAFVENVIPNTCSFTGREGHYSDPPLNFFMQRYAEAYVEEMSTFVDVILNNKEVPVSIDDGRLTVVYAAAANLSVKEKRTVKVSEIVADPKARY